MQDLLQLSWNVSNKATTLFLRGAHMRPEEPSWHTTTFTVKKELYQRPEDVAEEKSASQDSSWAAVRNNMSMSTVGSWNSNKAAQNLLISSCTHKVVGNWYVVTVMW
jgi:hypothetical protein